jgi:hypothetical protein
MAIAYQELAVAEDTSSDARRNYLAYAMRCYTTLMNFKSALPRQFLDEARTGMNLVASLQKSDIEKANGKKTAAAARADSAEGEEEGEEGEGSDDDS